MDKQLTENEAVPDELAQLRKEIGKLRLQAGLRKALSAELATQKKISEEATAQAKESARILEDLSKNLSRYVSPQVYKKLFDKKDKVELGSQRKKLTVFFSDIVGFTQLTDELESEDLTDFLNDYLDNMATIAIRHGATIDKYIGDAVMIFFGDPESNGPDQDAKKCVEMALDMQRYVGENALKWAKRHSFDRVLEIRIGISSGYCTVGNFGSEDRLDYTVLGGVVNLAARLESAARPGSILVSNETYKLTQDVIHYDIGRSYNLKGLHNQVTAYEVQVLDTDERPHAFSTDNVALTIKTQHLSKEELNLAIAFLQEKGSRLD
uniref:adenylate/guanylate cyclase domain-containing protein n=1 Tax=Limnohabitans sp. TaxID=1907725 RepID=UPI004047A838